MYEQFFGFRERPFDLTPNPRYLVLTESHREALSNLEYGIASRKGVTLLVGEAGSGKTTVIRTAIEKQPRRVHCVHLHNPTLSREEFAEMLATRFALSERALRSKTFMLLELEALLRSRQDHGESSVLVVDEAQSLSLDLLEEIRLLANIETNDQKLMSVIIAGQPELADRLNDRALRQLKQRIALRCELRPLTMPETAGYIAGRIHSAGGDASGVFTPEAVTVVHEHAQGIPRSISVIADNALLAGFAAGQRPVGTKLVQEVCRDFDLLPAEKRVNGHRAVAPERANPGSRIRPGLPPVGSPRPIPAALRETDPARNVPAESEPVTPDRPGSEMFGAFSTKRKRFSFFGN